MFVASVKLDELIHHFGRVPAVVAESEQWIKPGHTGRERLVCNRLATTIHKEKNPQPVVSGCWRLMTVAGKMTGKAPVTQTGQWPPGNQLLLGKTCIPLLASVASILLRL